MSGFRTFNHTSQPMWVTIYTLDRGFKEDWGNVDAGTFRDWNSGTYLHGSYYQIRGQWPTTDSKFDTDTTTTLGPSDPYERVLLGGDSGVYWSKPLVRTDNFLDVPVWITIYTGSGQTKTDYGDVEKGSTRDWSSGVQGEYSSHSILTVLAEWTPIAAPLDRTLQAAPPAKQESLKTSRMFGLKANGVAHLRLEMKDGQVTWTNVDGE
ncbi:hypothetical protein PMI15_03319 [Polaromonas sp. CF318]|uniref:hypothetical protein n=1 Tax=Polaromonas sp. CF318 TaxID=1144318 RepID=UPI0002711F57|nr:hypothetical protein [Polaromonas sp. CF318]EJL81989.1 hypothetical protein PMI15_03319 [Polaromonas sp. CF318]